MENITTSFDLSLITMSNFLGIMLLVVLSLGNLWRFRDRSPENMTLILLMFFSFTNCLVDPLSMRLMANPDCCTAQLLLAEIPGCSLPRFRQRWFGFIFSVII